MTALDHTWTAEPTWLHRLVRFFLKPPRLQMAALCHRKGKAGTEILLVRSRGTGRWILPKGWPAVNKTASDTAAMEAFEEAGIIGTVDKAPYARIRSRKGLEGGLSVPTTILVFCLKFQKQVEDFPEQGQRELAWVTPKVAASMVEETDLRRLIKRFDSKKHEIPLDH